MEPIDFYFDFASSYAYFASTCIDELAARHGRTVRWHPVMLATMFQATGGTPLPLVPVKGDYVRHDISRTARQHGIPYRQPDVFPELLLAPGRAMLWIRLQYGDELAVRFAKRCFRAYFAERAQLSDAAVVCKLAAELGVVEEALAAALLSPQVKDLFKQETGQALERGVFGSPFVIVDGEPFWGFDRFGQLEAWLAGRGASWRYWARKARGPVGAKWKTPKRDAAAAVAAAG
jgi:2-hydroxychromene-2-carboxylate isomerase